MSASHILLNRLVLPDDEAAESDNARANFLVDGTSSVVALALEHRVLLLGDGFTANASDLTINVGSGAFSAVNVARFAQDISAQKHSWHGEQHLYGPDRPAGQKVAIKRISPRDEASPQSLLDAIANEIRILAHPTLRSHANIVDLIGLGWTGTLYDDPASKPRRPVLLLEHASCGTLRDFFSLEDVSFTWDIKLGLAYDVVQGLEALDDAGVVHDDLKFENVLVFRNGPDSFRAALCDFGSALISTDFDADIPIHQAVFTPPWDAPELTIGSVLDDLYKADIYSYGLLFCRVFLEGGDPFQIKQFATPERSESSRAALIAQWKRDDQVHEVCKFAVRQPLQGGSQPYPLQQLAVLDEIFDSTVRTDPSARAQEHVELKNILKPELASQNDQQRMDFTLDDIQSEVIPPIFSNDLTKSVPTMQRCWNSLLPPNIATEIIGDLVNVASVEVHDAVVDRVGAAAYELAQCHVQGYGCVESNEEAATWLIRSAELGCRRAQADVRRLFDAMGFEIPDQIQQELPYWTVSNANSGSPSAMAELQQVDGEVYEYVRHDFNTTYGGMGIDIFTDDIRDAYSLQDPAEFLEKIGHPNDVVPFEDQDAEGLTWLHYAASNGASQVVQLLLQQENCNIDCRTDNGWTPLFMACAGGHFEAAKLLLTHGADAKAASQIGKTCLHMLQSFDPGEIENITSLLLSGGANIEAKDFKDETPLYSALLLRDGPDAIHVVNTLIRNGADPTALSKESYSCVDIAGMTLRPDFIASLLESTVFHGPDGEHTLIHHCATALKTLIISPRYHRLRHGGSSFASTIERILHMLISDQVVAYYINNFPAGHNPLHDACLWGSADLVEPLLNFPCIDINGQSRPRKGFHLPPLLEAVKLNDETIVKTLVRRGADVTLSDSEGRNVLHFAVEFAPGLLPFFLERLVDSGRDVQDFINAGTISRGFTPLDVAILTERFEEANLLITRGAQYRDFSRIGEAGERYSSLGMTGGSRPRMSFFLDMPPGKRPDPVICNNGFTLFHLTAASFDNALLETDPSPADNILFLLEHYATKEDANQRASKQETPLHVAALFGNTAVAQALLESAGADVNATDEKGATPLDFLAARRRGAGQDMREVHLVDDLERRTWKRRNADMERLLTSHGAVGGAFVHSRQ